MVFLSSAKCNAKPFGSLSLKRWEKFIAMSKCKLNINVKTKYKNWNQ